MVVDDAQIGDDVLDLLAVVKALTTDDAVGYPGADERIFDAVGLCVHAVQDGMIGKLLPFGNIVQNGVCNKSGFILLGQRAVDLDLTSLRVLGPQGLSFSLGIVFNHRICRIQDGLGTAVVLLQPDDHGISVLVFKVEDVFDGGSSEFIDTLVIIADHTDVVVTACQQADQQKLRIVGVLVLVHHDVAEAVAVLFQHIRELLEDAHGEDDDVVKVQRVGCLQALLVVVVYLGNHLLTVVASRFPQQVLRGHHFVLCRTDGGKDALGRHHLFLDAQLLERLLDDADRIVGIINSKAALVAQGSNLPTQDAHTRRVEGGCLDVQRLLAQHCLQTLL